MFDPNQALPDFQTQELEIQRKRAMADMLRKQSGTPAPTGQMVGNQFVAPSFAQYLPGLLNSLQSGYAESQAAKAEKDYGQQVAQAKQQWQSMLPQATAGMPGREELYGPQEMGGSPELAAVAEVAPTRPSTDAVLKATIAGLNIPGNERVAQVYGQGMMAENTREDAQAARKAETDARMAQERELRMATLTQQKAIADQNAANAAASNEQRAEAARESARLRELMIESQREGRTLALAVRAAGRAGSGGEGSGNAGKGVQQVEDPNNPGQVILVTNAEAASGKYRPAKQMNTDAKTEKAVEKVSQGQEQVRGIIDELRANYDNLDRAKAIPNTQRGGLSNTLASLGASGVGQFAGRVVGTENQASRDVISSSRIQLLNGIKQATGMSAQQLNSNVELQTWLKAVTDPTQSKQAVDRILNNIESFVVTNGKPMASPGATAPVMSPQDAQALEWANSNPSDPRAAAIRQRLGAR